MMRAALYASGSRGVGSCIVPPAVGSRAPCAIPRLSHQVLRVSTLRTQRPAIIAVLTVAPSRAMIRRRPTEKPLHADRSTSVALTAEQQLKLVSRAWGKQTGYVFFPTIRGDATDKGQRIRGY